LNALDIIFLTLIGVSILYSLIRGLIREVFSFLSVIVGFCGASYGYLAMADRLRPWVKNETFAQVLGFVVLFIFLALAISLLGKALSRLANKADLSLGDHLGGGAFGFLKAIFLIALILLVLTAFLPPRSKVLSESKVSPHVLAIARQLSFLVPEKLRIIYIAREKELKKYWASKELAREKIEIKGGNRG
jgi:membrane protein required for colicin V production